MPKLILHAGIYKTGTTAIQTFAAQNRADLLRQGVFYPKLHLYYARLNDAHHFFIHAAARNKMLHREMVLVRGWRRAAESKKLTVLLSSEAVWRNLGPSAAGDWIDRRRAYLVRLADLLSDFDVQLAVVLRRQDEYIRSFYQEYILQWHEQWYEVNSFHSLFQRESKPMSFSQFRQFSRGNLLRLRENLSLMEEIFPQIKVLLYEDLKHTGDLVVNFFSKLGIQANGMQSVGLVHKSPGIPQHHAKFLLTPGIKTRAQRNDILNWIETNEVRQVLREEFPRSTRYTLWENPEAQAEFFASYEDENEAIRKRYFPQRKRLFEPPTAAEMRGKNRSLSEGSKKRLIALAYQSGLISASHANSLSTGTWSNTSLYSGAVLAQRVGCKWRRFAGKLRRGDWFNII